MKEKIKELVNYLNKASTAYYKYDNPIMTDTEYDKLYDELTKIENETGIILSNSPTQKVQGEILEKLEKVVHSKPMLSAQKTKSIDDIKKFSNNKNVILSYKMDGLTIVLRYNNGKFKQAITRGTGVIGEDVTHSAKMFTNIPLTIPYKFPLEVRGECVISWENFKKINEKLNETYAHPRNLASGSVRQLNSNIVKERFLEFIAFDLINAEKWDGIYTKDISFDFLTNIGFDVVEYKPSNTNNIEQDIKLFNPVNYKYPVDGVICEFNDLNYAMSLGATAHHENRLIALKWKDESEDTILKNVEFSMGRTGILTPVAIFDTVQIDGTDVSRASLHNISIIKKLKLGINDEISVAKMNMIIPQVTENHTQSNNLIIPDTCPYCGAKTAIQKDNDSEVLVCTNSDCSGKKLGRFINFVGKSGMNIDGLSEATLDKFIRKGWLNTFSDIYHLDEHKNEICCMNGLGLKSYNNLWNSIEKSKNVKLENFLVALGIPNVGKTASKTISKYFNGEWNKFEMAIQNLFDFTKLTDFGQVMNNSIIDWYHDENNLATDELFQIVNIVKPEQNTIQNSNGVFTGAKLYCTGSFACGKKDELKQMVENAGGEFASGYAKSLDYLVVGSLKSSSKEDKARKDGVPILTEEEFLKMLK